MNSEKAIFLGAVACEEFQNDVKVYTSKDNYFGSDAILLASFAAPTAKTRAVDFGSGCGIIPLFWASRARCSKIYGVELQRAASLMAGLSVEESGLRDKIEMINADLRELNGILPAGGFDLVTMNPPYNSLGSGIISEGASDKLARHETACTLNEAVKAAARLLRTGGRFCICHRPERLADIAVEFRNADCELKRIRFVQYNEHKAPWIVLCEGKKSRNSGVSVEPPLLIQKDGEYTDEYREIYNEYR